MEYIGPRPAAFNCSPKPVIGDWYLKGFADAYAAHWPAAPSGPAGEQYKRGYALGIAAVQREFSEALNALTHRQEATAVIPV
jgi:hypothetical protein